MKMNECIEEFKFQAYWTMMSGLFDLQGCIGVAREFLKEQGWPIAWIARAEAETLAAVNRMNSGRSNEKT
jgi:hypothetical protein